MITVYLKLHKSNEVKQIGKCFNQKRVFNTIRRYLRFRGIRSTAFRLWETDNKTWFESNAYSDGYFYIEGTQLESLMQQSTKIS